MGSFNVDQVPNLPGAIMNQQQLSSASTVHTRTVKGQAAVLRTDIDLNSQQARLLRIVNGFTPTAWLLELLCVDQTLSDEVVGDLEHQGLIARIQ